MLRILMQQYRKKKKNLSPESEQEIIRELRCLQDSILKDDKVAAAQFAKQAERFTKTHLKKNTFDHIIEIAFALLFALFIAIVIRQMWFEFYEIPTGSMRPTLQEKDRLVVSKTQFGINFPLTPKHFYFDQADVERNGIIVFTGQDMDIRDVDTMYFYIFPGKKQYIKRLMGKPGDTLYFYGGQLYGIDKEDNDITGQLQPAMLDNVNHVPFIQFDGKVITPMPPVGGIYSPVIFYQMNLPVAKMFVNPFHQIDTQMLYKTVTPTKMEYYDLWGFKHYAMTRILSASELQKLYPSLIMSEKTDYYLQFVHHPNLSNGKLEKDLFGRIRPNLGLMYTYLPLQEEHLKNLFQNLYTARFIVNNGFARRYGNPEMSQQNKHFYPYFPGIPNGCYEFMDGKVYQIKWQGLSVKLSDNHPLYQFDIARLVTLFNLGIEFDTRFNPGMLPINILPSRFAFYKEGGLYVMGKKIFDSTDPTLQSFIKSEMQKASSNSSYKPFIDDKPPMVNGTISKEFIKQYGITIPDGQYLVLGDNYAMSADSRDFGFVPQGNLRGVPTFIFWPFGDRFGALHQPSYPIFTAPRVAIWGLALIVYLIWRIFHNKRHRLPYKELE
ncbi:MAG: signal peptidase I [Chlamydiales bacterium]|nr:signal peptidase I [Chlamydiales bacterium]